MSDASELLKQATALKREGNLDSAIASIEQALGRVGVGDSERQQAHRKRISYLILAERPDDALAAADEMLGEATDQAMGIADLVGTSYAISYRQRAKAWAAKGDSEASLMDEVRASWHWQRAMRLQGRDKREQTLKRTAKDLMEPIEGLGLPLKQKTVMDLTSAGLQDPDPEAMVERFRRALVELK